MAAHRISEKGKQKQLEKEISWGQIPPEERHHYRAAELTQWQEHVEFGAVRALSVEESRQVLDDTDPSRILRARFAYKEEDASLGPKAKARLCVAGHCDPDLGQKDMAVDAPTASRLSLLVCLQLALARGWRASIADIKAAFLNGVEAPRGLYFRQPRRGIPTLQPGQIVEIVKGVFGLSTSPKRWWLKLSRELKDMVFEVPGVGKVLVEPNAIDPCV